MSPLLSFLLHVSCLALLSIANGEGRAPHGIAYENPVAFSPSAYEFFHPKAQVPDSKSPCAASSCSPLPIAAQMDDGTTALESKVSTQKESGHQLGAGGIVGLVFGLAFAVLLAMGVYYVLNIRRSNANKANYVQSNA
ncbi:hypothetical protein Goarm_008445 [Gossypium armourianum]|uniref:Transmembrane protein n=1 Tax=Gossypium armourianum TaxID=34283 RepID=A0A7J9JPX6_9ROSI|nr:hypothetical protein [Gossypium armourianum]